MPSYINRRTSNYSLYSEAFTESRVHGFQTFSKFRGIDFAVGLLNGYRVGERRFVPDMTLAEDPENRENATRIPLAWNETPANFDKRVAISSRLIINSPGISIGFSAYIRATKDENGTPLNMAAFGLDTETILARGFPGN